MKFMLAQWLLAVTARLITQGFEILFFINFMNLLIAGSAWLVTKNHLWTVDYFALLFNFGGITLVLNANYSA
jgi:hypothetical protein